MSARLRAALAERAESGLLRRLSTPAGIDFCSNDYLGLARDPALNAEILERMAADSGASGATGSRLISGNSPAAEALEAHIAAFHRAPAGLLFASGFAANCGLLAALAGAGDTLVMDRLIHASAIDGARLSKAARLVFEHNDHADLRRSLAQAQGRIFIVVESVYSMDGDCTDLAALADLAEEFDAALIVDEAHSTGIVGPGGRGAVCEAGLEERVFARVCTFGKALGLHGAIVLGSGLLKDYLVNFARPFVFSTGPSPHTLAALAAVYDRLPGLDEERARLQARVRSFIARRQQSSWQWLPSESWIQSVLVPGNHRVREVAGVLEAAGIQAVPITAPTVPAGSERIRLCLHTFNTDDEIERLMDALEDAHTRCNRSLSPA